MRPYQELLSARSSEIRSHLSLITELNEAAISRYGIGRLGTIQTEHVEILKSGFLVHLYNVVEAVMDQILLEVASCSVRYPPGTWSEAVRTEWIRTRAGIERNIDVDKRLRRTKKILEETIAEAIDVNFRISIRGGNWSNTEIVRISGRLGCVLRIPEKVENLASNIAFQDDLAPMKYVRHKRNLLSHGEETFGSGADRLSPDDLDRLQEPVLKYMSTVTNSYDQFLDGKEFLNEHAVA